MRSILMAGAALMLGAAPVAALAQDMTGGTDTIEDRRGYDALNDQQRVMYDRWPMDRQTAYTAWPADRQTDFWTWPAEQQTYYWTLEPMQQEAYWVLTPEQRMKVYAMAPAQRTAAWNSIVRQINGTPAPASTAANNPASSRMAGENIRYVSKEIVQGGARAVQPADYPVCSATIKDSCINPYAAGKRGPKPLGYWPGKPASKM